MANMSELGAVWAALELFASDFDQWLTYSVLQSDMKEFLVKNNNDRYGMGIPGWEIFGMNSLTQQTFWCLQ